MKKIFFYLVVCAFCFFLCGCSSLSEAFRVAWGSSTKALERARKDSLRQTFRCASDKCFDAVIATVALERAQAETPSDEISSSAGRSLTTKNSETFRNPASTLQVFLKDRKRQIIVLMGIPGAVDTTEVGVFMRAVTDDVTDVEISSLSLQARDEVANILFPSLENIFGVSAVDLNPSQSATTSP